MTVVAAHRTRTHYWSNRRWRKPVSSEVTRSYCGACGACLDPDNRYHADLELGYAGSTGAKCSCGVYNDIVPWFRHSKPARTA